MKSLLVAVAVVVVLVVGLGFYLGWFAVAWDSTDGKGHLTGTLDEDKVREDKNKALEAIQDLGHQAKDKAAASTEKSRDQATPPAARPPQD